LILFFFTQSTKTFEPSSSIDPTYPSKQSLRLIVTLVSFSSQLNATIFNKNISSLEKKNFNAVLIPSLILKDNFLVSYFSFFWNFDLSIQFGQFFDDVSSSLLM
jgi:hypothetical protein